MTHPLFAVLPASVDDPAAPSGGNRYDREVLRRLAGPRDQTLAAVRPEHPPATSPRSGPGVTPVPPDRSVRETLIGGSWPRPEPAARQALAGALGAVPDGAVVLIDGLIACGVPELLEPHATRLRLAVLVHLPLSDETGLPAAEAAALRACESRTLRLAATVIATSTAAARRVEELHGVAGVHAIPPGVDPAPLAVPSDTGARFLNVASLTHRKGQDLLLAALRQLGDLSWSCTVAGAGRVPGTDTTAPASLVLDDRTGDWEADSLPEALENPRAHQVRFAGALGGAALDRAYANADLFVLPSRAETYGMVVTEALARGIPVVAANVGGVAEALGAAPDGGIPGRLIPPDDPAALAAALRAWSTDGGLRERWRQNARARRAELTGWDETARRLREVLDGLTPTAPHPDGV